ncbi:MAG: zf-HC2 domain-containing protein [Nitrospira sp.]|nr:zf-HC2 domain-containing protein [Nitrospira sp.]
MAQEEGAVIVPEITCQEVVQWASAYLDEHIEDDRKRQIVLHLAICAGCETYVKQIATVRDLVGVLPMTVEQPSDSQRLRQAFTAKARRSVSSD